MNIRAVLRQPVLSLAIHAGEARWTLGAAGTIARVGAVPLPPGAVADGVVVDPTATGRALAEAPGLPRHRRLRAVVALPAQRSVFRSLELPSLRGKQFDELARREIRRELPMLAENAHIAWCRTLERNGATRLLVIGVARDVLDSHLAAARAARLPVVAADLRVIAAARAIGHPDCIVANVEEDEAELAVLRDGVPVLVRHIMMAAAPAEAAWAQQLVEELARTLKFYRDSHRDDTAVDALPVSLVGGEARRALLTVDLAADSGRSLAMPPLALAVEPEREAARFAANIGLALKDLAA